MAISEYCDFVIVACDDERDEKGILQFKVQVSDSPAGESQPELRSVPTAMRHDLSALEDRKLDLRGLIKLGEELSALLFSDLGRQLFVRSVQELKPHQGLRLRLHLPPRLAYIPWEYMYFQREGGEKDSTGFLALDPQVSVMRQETLARSTQSDIILKTCRLLIVMAIPTGWVTFDLDRERANIEEAFRGASGIEIDLLENPLRQQLSDKLLQGADIFHFAGRSYFEKHLGEAFGSIKGEGAIVLVSDDGEPDHIPAATLAINLRGNDIRLAFLNSGESARRDGYNVWSGLAAALVKVRIPAVVAMQHSLHDKSAIEFCRSFYRALATGVPLDRAVSEGRRAIFNCSSEDDRDWGVPVLYLQARNLALHLASDQVDQTSLRDAIVGHFKIEDLEVLCADLQQDLSAAGLDLDVSLEMVGGSGKEGKILNLIQYLDNREYLEYLVRAVRRERPGII